MSQFRSNSIKILYEKIALSVYHACKEGNIESLKGLLRPFIDTPQLCDIINWKGSDCWPLRGTPLMIASENGRFEIVKFLLQFPCIDVHAISFTVLSPNGDYSISNALSVAAWKGETKIVRELLEAGAALSINSGFELLWGPSIRGHIEVVRELLNADIDVSLKPNVLCNFYGNSLIAAFEKGHFILARELLDAGAETTGVSYKNMRSLLIASNASDI